MSRMHGGGHWVGVHLPGQVRVALGDVVELAYSASRWLHKLRRAVPPIVSVMPDVSQNHSRTK